MQKLESRRPTLGDVLAWTDSEVPRVRLLLALRRLWMTQLYPRLRDEYEEAGGPPAAASLSAVKRLVDGLPSLRWFCWLDGYIQERLWAEVGRMADARMPLVDHLLEPGPDDLGTLELDPRFAQPEYYATYDFHRQDQGIWRDDRGAVVYALGARVVHVGKTDPLALHDKLVGDLPVVAPARVLDLGCGYGKTTFSLKRRYPDAEVTGVDLSAPCLRLARRLATERDLAIHWRQADAEHLPDADGRYDLVTLSMVLHELPMPSIAGVFREALRVLRPGGVFAALETRLTGDPLRDLLGAYHSEITGEPYINAFRGADFGGFARDAGFAAVDVLDWYPTPNPVPQHPRRWATAWSLLLARKAGS